MFCVISHPQTVSKIVEKALAPIAGQKFASHQDLAKNIHLEGLTEAERNQLSGDQPMATIIAVATIKGWILPDSVGVFVQSFIGQSGPAR